MKINHIYLQTYKRIHVNGSTRRYFKLIVVVQLLQEQNPTTTTIKDKYKKKSLYSVQRYIN